MDEIAANEATAINNIDSKRFLRKESGFLPSRRSSNMLEMQEMLIPGDINVQESKMGLFIDVLDGKNVTRVDTSEHACVSPRFVDDTGTMVEELTVRNCNSGNLEIGASSARDKMMHKGQNNWQQFHRRAEGAVTGVWEDSGSTLFPELLNNKQQSENQKDTMDNSRREEKQPALCNTLLSPGGIRTKILSQSGFSQYFVKNTLKGKGVICSGPSHDGLVHIRDQNHQKDALRDFNSAPDSSKETIVHPSDGIAESWPNVSGVHDGLCLREWLKAGQNKVDKSKSLYIFKQILDLVDSSHSRGVALQALRPSSFKLTLSNQVLYTGSPIQKELMGNIVGKEFHHMENNGDEKRPLEHDPLLGDNRSSKRRKHGDERNSFRRWPQFTARAGFKYGNAHDIGAVNGFPRDSGYGFNEESIPKRDDSYPIQSMSNTLHLLASSESARTHAIAMMDLRQRILPPSFLSENPKEAGFCLWLLHPEALSRPTTRDILQSQLVSGIQQSSMEELSSSIDQEDAESDLMLHFLASVKEQKQKSATKLVKDIRYLESDISEIELRRPNNVFLGEQKQSYESEGNGSIQENRPTLGEKLRPSAFSSSGGSRLISNINHLEHAYFSVRSSIGIPNSDTNKPGEHEILRSRENNMGAIKKEANNKPVDHLGVFFKGLCKYARYSKFEVRGTLRNGDFSSMGNVICSLGFDRDEDYFATAGVAKKIKVYDFQALLNDSVDIHYPAVEMSNKSKLSCICWNSYIRNYLASTDYDGVVKLWDAGTGEAVSHHIEHERRAWSVDFSPVDPIKLASGSDDCSVKLWSINEKKSLATIKSVANVCCVQFSPYSTHLLSFGSADYRTYCYDLRHTSTPLCTLAGHDRAVSYVKFLDSGTLVSASTDNTLKLWDLNKANNGCLSTSSCILTFKGHTNEKNFVGLSVADGYIACGSETNEFGSIDPVSGKETENESNQFVSSVCWRKKSDMVVAANSSGCLKLLQMILMKRIQQKIGQAKHQTLLRKSPVCKTRLYPLPSGFHGILASCQLQHSANYLLLFPIGISEA
ncbi:G-protein beta WD-40 repeat-containing protein [Cynara cardunculus var. scolymus]|uniref:G-protein beta WD-40 repeat-containing protein n=1 Tax=Cynara cardunculus var. scolymus TaxID=59895 RepID=A0A118JWI4_CYNCS|nr:G-protein beta WD-40 repeat-containing protein [Cynara cardunculus var. scolymus]